MFNVMPKHKYIDYQLLTTLARRWLYTWQINQTQKHLKQTKTKQNEKHH